jgi:hypothetical protein
MIEEHKGPWRSRAVLRDAMNARVALQDTRTGHVQAANVIRFPAGWRCHWIDMWDAPAYAKALARRAMNQLPLL